MRLIFALAVLLLPGLNSFAQKKHIRFLNNPHFEWISDSLAPHTTIYYEKGSYAEAHKEILKEKIKYYLQRTQAFAGIENYNHPIHYFILESRKKMKILLGRETNGNADPENDLVTAIYSEKIKSAFSHHELFHLVAMKEWGPSEIWFNEGMAVYSDNNWQGYPLHELSKYLIDHGKFISLKKMSKRIRFYNSMITYPLLGSFAKFIDETYGRKATQLIWQKGKKNMKDYLGKSLADLEKEWIAKLQSVPYSDIRYMEK